MTQIFDFHQVISALMTLLITPTTTLLLVKTSLKNRSYTKVLLSNDFTKPLCPVASLQCFK